MITALMLCAVLAVPVMAEEETERISEITEDLFIENAEEPEEIVGDMVIQEDPETVVWEDTSEPETEPDADPIIIDEEVMTPENTAYAAERPESIEIGGTAEMPVHIPSSGTVGKMSSSLVEHGNAVYAGEFKRKNGDSQADILRKASMQMGLNEENTGLECLAAAGYYDIYDDSFTSDAESRIYGLMTDAVKSFSTGRKDLQFTPENTIWKCDAGDLDYAMDDFRSGMQDRAGQILTDALILTEYDNPEYYWVRDVNWEWQIRYDSGSGEYYLQRIGVYPKEYFPGAISRNKTARGMIDGIYKELCSRGNSDFNQDGTVSDYEFLLALHDYICENTYYDYARLNQTISQTSGASFSIFTPDGLFNKKYGGMVCDGYARAFKIFCDRRKLESFVAMSREHAWNVVRYAGSWYTVDLTWDDGQPSPWISDETNYSQWVNDVNIRHDYFLCGTSQAKAGNSVHDIMECTYWSGRSIETPMLAVGNYPVSADQHRVFCSKIKSSKGSADCLRKDTFTYTCDVCGKTATETWETIRDGEDDVRHTYGAWKTIVRPTYTSCGRDERYCRYCGYGQYRTTSALDPCLKVSKPSNKKISLKKGKKYTVKATSKTSVSYVSSNKKIATVSGKGVIKGIKKGKCTVTVKSGTKSIKITVTVK